MDLRQIRYFVRVVELGSMGRAALELDVATSTLSEQISRLEGELATRLLQRRSTGVYPTEAGLDFMHQAQGVLRQVEVARAAAQKGRLSGQVSIGLAATTASVLAIPIVAAMRERYPTVRVRIVEGLTSHLEAALNSRQIDLAVLFGRVSGKRWSVVPLLDESLFLIGCRNMPELQFLPARARLSVEQLRAVPLVMPGANHALRAQLQSAMHSVGADPVIALEIDGAHSVLKAVRAGLGATVQPGSLVSGLSLDQERRSARAPGLVIHEIAGENLSRRSSLASLSDDELSPAGLAARVTVIQVMRELVTEGLWCGASLIPP